MGAGGGGGGGNGKGVQKRDWAGTGNIQQTAEGGWYGGWRDGGRGGLWGVHIVYR